MLYSVQFHTSFMLLSCILAIAALDGAWVVATSPPALAQWQSWLRRFGHDDYKYPEWVEAQIASCACVVTDAAPAPFPPLEPGDSLLPSLRFKCTSELDRVKRSPRRRESDTYDLITFCQAKEWLLTRMPPPDQHSLPGSVTVKHASLLDDTASFTIMALHAAPWARQLPRAAQFAYLLPYSTYRESLSSWRPLYFARFFQRVANASSTAEAMKLLTQPGWSPEAHNSFTDVFRDIWPDYGADPAVARDTYLQWSSSTAPPVLAPFDFTAYGYGSCTAHALLLVYIARSVGIPARLVGTPCWNSGEFAGLATDNPSVEDCYRGGARGDWGGHYLNNHNWIEYWDSGRGRWAFLNSPPGAGDAPDSGLCRWSARHGCDYNEETATCPPLEAGGPAAASRDHGIFAATWALPGDCEPAEEAAGRCTPSVTAPTTAAAAEAHRRGDGSESVFHASRFALSSGTRVSPLVWASSHTMPSGARAHAQGLRLVNRTDHYRCRL